MRLRNRRRAGAVLAGLLIVAPGLSGCLATTVAGATLGAAGLAVHTAAKATAFTLGTAGKVAGAAVHLATGAGRPAKAPPSSSR